MAGLEQLGLGFGQRFESFLDRCQAAERLTHSLAGRRMQVSDGPFRHRIRAVVQAAHGRMID